MSDTETIWQPQRGPQAALIDAPFPEILYGGARGGGKTDGVLGKYGIKAETYGPGFNAIFFRRELPMLDDAIERSQQIYTPIGATWHEQKKMWRFPGGGRLRFRPLERVADAEKYQGQNISDACVEEVGNYPDSRPIDRLNGVLRSVSGVPTQLILTGNPGGAGQHWIKSRYIDPAPGGMTPLVRTLPNGKEHRYIFIPSKLQNNKLLMANDPDYINRLYLVGSTELVRAWLDGDWNAVEGAFFDCWSEKMIIAPFPIPKDWVRFKSMDWGSARPFSVGWWAIVTDDYTLSTGQVLPRGALVRHREWYGMKPGEPNVGLKLTAEAVGRGIADRSKSDPTIKYGVADPATFTADGGPSIMERLHHDEKKLLFKHGKKASYWRKADNRRVAQSGHMGGWDQMRQRMIGKVDADGVPEGVPMLYAFTTCTDSIRTIPSLQHDDLRPEDLDTDSEDHAADEWRYACMSRPMPAALNTNNRQPVTAQPTLNELLNMQKKAKASRRI